MNTLPPIRRAILVEADPAAAFEVFTAGLVLDRYQGQIAAKDADDDADTRVAWRAASSASPSARGW